MKPKPPWQAPSCGFTLELWSWEEAAGEDRQRMGIRVAWPAGPGGLPEWGWEGAGGQQKTAAAGASTVGLRGER